MTAAWYAIILFGFGASLAVEVPILILGLATRHSMAVRLAAGVWLTACTYPIVAVTLPIAIGATFGRVVYLVVAETLAPLMEIGIFWAAFGGATIRRDATTILLANALSFLAGELLMMGGVW